MKFDFVKLGDIATYINGYAFKPSDWSNNGIPIIRIQNLTGNDYENNYFDGEIDDKYKIKDGDMLISWSASIGIYEWNGGTAWLNQHIFKVVFDKIEIDKQYFKYAVSNALNKSILMLHGSTMKHFTKNVFDSIPIKIYSNQQQQKIVDVLDKVENLIDNRHQQLNLLDELIESRFIEMFGDPVTNPMGWGIKKLKDITIKISDGVHEKPNYTIEGMPFISVLNINKGVLDFSNCKYVSKNDYMKMIQSTNPEKGDILYTKVGATYGISAHVDTDRNFCLYVSVCLIKPNHDIVNSKFLTESMRLPYIKHQADRRIKGIGVPDLHLNQIREFDILFPPVELQNKFAAIVEQTEKTKETIKKSINELNLLKDSLMQKYFG